MKFTEMLSERWQNAGSMLCVGLDPNPTRFPHELAGRSTALYDFCCGIIDATADLVCAFKPQIAYFASCGAEAELKAVIDYIHANHPKVPVILDAKRGDIGSTAEHYAREAFERYEADCVTLSPFMGFDTIKPYLAYENKGAFILCRTSNPGGDDIQMLEVNGEKIYERLARLAAGLTRPRMDQPRTTRVPAIRSCPQRRSARKISRTLTMPSKGPMKGILPTSCTGK